MITNPKKLFFGCYGHEWVKNTCQVFVENSLQVRDIFADIFPIRPIIKHYRNIRGLSFFLETKVEVQTMGAAQGKYGKVPAAVPGECGISPQVRNSFCCYVLRQDLSSTMISSSSVAFVPQHWSPLQ